MPSFSEGRGQGLLGLTLSRTARRLNEESLLVTGLWLSALRDRRVHAARWHGESGELGSSWQTPQLSLWPG